MGMQTPDNVSPLELDKVLEIVNDLARKSGEGNYIYRGEHKPNPKVSSSLYRRYEKIDEQGDGIEAIQEEILAQAKAHARYMGEFSDFDILADLRHNGGAVNIIDFTSDYLIALFFACDGAFNKPGKVFLLPKIGDSYRTEEPISPVSRVIAQKSVFVMPDKGFVDAKPDHTVTIAADIKPAVLDYLRRQHGISAETIYNDLYGFIQHQEIHKAAYAKLHKGVILASLGEYQQAIEPYTKAIELNSQNAITYNKRGEAYHELGAYSSAIVDYEKALSFDPENDAIYHNIGLAYAQQGEYRQAIEYYDRALKFASDDYTQYLRLEALLRIREWEQAKQSLQLAPFQGMDIVTLFRNDYENVSDFEQKTGLELPEDIAEMLGG